jgi:hypothetical protein
VSAPKKRTSKPKAGTAGAELPGGWIKFVRRSGGTGPAFELRCTYCGAWKASATTERERDALAEGHAKECPAAKHALETRHKARELATSTSRAESWTREQTWWLHNNRRFLTNHPPRIPPPEDRFSQRAISCSARKAGAAVYRKPHSDYSLCARGARRTVALRPAAPLVAG